MTDQSTNQPTNQLTNRSVDASGDGIDRRELLKGVTAAGIGGLGFSGSALAHPKPNAITLRAVKVPVRYEITVSGEIEMGQTAGETDRIVDSSVARGFIGTVGELDDYRFSGQITAFDVDIADALEVSVNGNRVEDPVGLPRPRQPNRIRVQARGQRVPYAFTVGGTVRKGPNADGGDRIVDGDTVRGTVAGDGFDDYRYSGPISFDSGDGPLEVTLRLQ